MPLGSIWGSRAGLETRRGLPVGAAGRPPASPLRGEIVWRAVVPAALLLCGLLAAPPRALGKGGSCLTDACHEPIREIARPHWDEMLEPGQCLGCHEPAGSDHDFEAASRRERCLECHPEVARNPVSEASRHGQLAGGCVDCHDPHGGPAPLFLKAGKPDDLGALCLRCHKKEFAQRRFKHEPFARGGCAECHSEHAAKEPWLLQAEEGPGLCGRCHESIVDRLRTARSVHEPAAEGCSDCHDPHASQQPLLVHKRTRLLCADCHEEVTDAADQMKWHRGAILGRRTCLRCHDPHSSDHAEVLVAAQDDLCLDCHDRKLRSKNGVVADIKRWLRRNDQWHEPLTEKGCGACHRAHAGNAFGLLVKSFPEGFYAPFDVERYALCFECHGQELVTAERSRTATKFRDGDTNLHFVHVNRVERGRSCRACHEPHATRETLHIRDSVPFGSWTMPLVYERSASGGSCASACHERRGYDRDRGPLTGRLGTP